MRHLIQERWDAYMRHCVAGVTGQGKDKQAAFAICKAGGNRAGYYEAGTKQVTAKGRRAMRRHAQDAARAGKDAAYDKAIKKEDTMTTMRTLIERCESVMAEGDGVLMMVGREKYSDKLPAWMTAAGFWREIKLSKMVKGDKKIKELWDVVNATVREGVPDTDIDRADEMLAGEQGRTVARYILKNADLSDVESVKAVIRKMF